jgi:hypothetical protein
MRHLRNWLDPTYCRLHGIKLQAHLQDLALKRALGVENSSVATKYGIAV